MTALLGGRRRELPVGATVFDRWWPYRSGKVIRVLKTRTVVRWSDGEEWTYDREHEVKYLEARTV